MTFDQSSQFTVGTPDIVQESVAVTQALRRFLDRVAALKPNAERSASLVADLDAWSERLERAAGSEDESLWRKAQRHQPPALLPSLDYVENGETLEGHVTFGRFHVGRRAAHGGAISLMFDEVMGALSGSGKRTRARTAYLHVDFRALTPIDETLAVRAWFEAEHGRKRFLRARIHHGDIVCAEAHGLWIELKPDQP